MRAILLLLLIAACKTTLGQMMVQASGSVTESQSAIGHISVPSLMSLQVQTNNNEVRFENPLDFINGKQFPGFLNVKVVSTQPWLVSFRALSPYFTPLTKGASPDMPVEVMRIKQPGKNTWRNLSSNTQPLLYSDNNRIANTYNFDASFELGWKYRSGSYTTTVLFTLTPQ